MLFRLPSRRYVSRKEVFKDAKASKKTQKRLTGRFVITTESPLTTHYDDIVSRVPQRCSATYGPTANTVDLGGPMSVVILTTPSFATWLENDVFMTELLETTLGTRSRNLLEHVLIKVVAAVVDRLPPPDHNGSPGKEGFAVLYGPPPFVLPDYRWDDYIAVGSQSSIVFSFNRKYNSGGTRCIQSPRCSPRMTPKSIVLPLAKTIFQNGRESTLITSSWRKTSGSLMLKRVTQPGRIYKGRASERILVLPIGSSILAQVKGIPLTMPRQAVSSMGNVIRQLRVNDSGKQVIPASHELEANISRYVQPPKAVSVWAEVTLGRPTPYEEANSKLGIIQYLADFRHEASSLHRVLSGGGGWGLKEGLVSLDPQSDVDFMPQAEDMEDANASRQEELREIVPHGSFVQFFWVPESDPEPAPQVWRTKKEVKKSIDQQLVLGITPSSMDQLNSTPTSLGSSEPGEIRVYDNHFGALSENGIFFIQEDRDYRKIRSSKVDLPGSFIRHFSSPILQRSTILGPKIQF